MLRAAALAGTQLGKKCKVLMDCGELVPDEIVIAIIAERFDKPDCTNGVIFDGFPRTIPQAEALDRMLAERGKQIDLVIELKVNDEALIARVESRIRQGGPRRGDDTPETLRHRLGVYYKNTAPLLEYYGQQGKIVTVDGMSAIEEVTRAIAKVIDGRHA
jgi:adenylate kinase